MKNNTSKNINDYKRINHLKGKKKFKDNEEIERI